jgi:hypothetical protein
MDDRLRRRFSDPEAANALMHELATLLKRCDLEDPKDEEEALTIVYQLVALMKLHARCC